MKFLSQFINFRMGLVGALIMGGIVYFVNQDYGWQPALIAALKQGMYTLLFGGIVIRLYEKLSCRYTSKFKSITAATFIPTILAVTATYWVHQLKGTAKPIESTIPTIVLAIPGFLFIALKNRSRRDSEIKALH